MYQRIRGSLLVAALGLAACSDGSTTPEPSAGTISFSWQGGGSSGTVQMTGEPTFDSEGDLAEREFVLAVRDFLIDDFGSPLLILGGEPSSGGTTFVELDVSARRVGSFRIDPECDPSSQTDCALGLVELDLDGGSSGGPGEAELVSGTVRITRLTDDRIEGIFSGTGEWLEFDESGEEVRIVSVAITSGSFDLPLWDMDDLRRAGAQFARAR